MRAAEPNQESKSVTAMRAANEKVKFVNEQDFDSKTGFVSMRERERR